MKPLLIVNPRAGRGRDAAQITELAKVVERALGPVDVAVTERSRHAISLAEGAAKEGRELVLAAGGDGTLHEVTNGVLAGGGKTRVGFLGLGTGGDFRRSLGLEHRLDHYLEAIRSGRERAVDVGRLTYTDVSGARQTRHFLNVLSVGMGGLVDRYVANVSKSAGGTLAYLAASVRAFAECTRLRLACSVTSAGARQERPLRSYMLAICNGRYFGSGMHVAPMAQVDDGRFEVVSMDAPSKIALGLVARSIYTGKHLDSPHVQTFPCDGLEIRYQPGGDQPVLPLDVDGEPLGGLPLEITLLRRALVLRA